MAVNLQTMPHTTSGSPRKLELVAPRLSIRGWLPSTQQEHMKLAVLRIDIKAKAKNSGAESAGKLAEAIRGGFWREILERRLRGEVLPTMADFEQIFGNRTFERESRESCC